MMIHSRYFIWSSSLILYSSAQFWSSIWCLSKWWFARWYTYLNSDFKKGGWSPEEDILLCEVNGCFLCSMASHLSLTSLFYNSDLTKYFEILDFIFYCLFFCLSILYDGLESIDILKDFRIASAVTMAIDFNPSFCACIVL